MVLVRCLRGARVSKAGSVCMLLQLCGGVLARKAVGSYSGIQAPEQSLVMLWGLKAKQRHARGKGGAPIIVGVRGVQPLGPVS